MISEEIREENCVYDVPDDDTIAFGVRMRGFSMLYPKCNRPTYEGVFDEDDYDYDGEDEDGFGYFDKLSDVQRREFWENIVEKKVKFLEEEAEAQVQMKAWMRATNYVEPTYKEILERMRRNEEVNYD